MSWERYRVITTFKLSFNQCCTGCRTITLDVFIIFVPKRLHEIVCSCALQFMAECIAGQFTGAFLSSTHLPSTRTCWAWCSCVSLATWSQRLWLDTLATCAWLTSYHGPLRGLIWKQTSPTREYKLGKFMSNTSWVLVEWQYTNTLRLHSFPLLGHVLLNISTKHRPWSCTAVCIKCSWRKRRTVFQF